MDARGGRTGRFAVGASVTLEQLEGDPHALLARLRLGRGVTTAGLATAPLLLAGVAWMPQILVPLWILAASISLMRTPAHARRAAAAAAMTKPTATVPAMTSQLPAPDPYQKALPNGGSQSNCPYR